MPKLVDLELGTSKLQPFSFNRTRGDGQTVTVHVVMRILTKTELDIARVNAKTTIRDLTRGAAELDGRTHDELFEDAKAVEILSVACRDPEDPSKPWAMPLEIANMLTTTEIAALWRVYEEHQEMCGPILHDMTVEQFNAAVEAVAKEGSADPFALLATPMRNACTVFMARELQRLRMESSSASSDSPSPNSDDATPRSDEDRDADIAALRDQIAALTVRIGEIESKAA